MENYLKPQIIEESTIERKLVFAEVQTQPDGCSTF